MTLLERLRELERQATPGPWRWTDVDYGQGFESYKEATDGPFDALWSDGANKPVMVAQDASAYSANFDTPHDIDAEFIRFSREALPALIAVAEAARELAEVARLRGDDELPHPANDPKLWTARMQAAWDEASAALAKLEVEA